MSKNIADLTQRETAGRLQDTQRRVTKQETKEPPATVFANILRAMSSAGLRLEDDGSNPGVIIQDGGNVELAAIARVGTPATLTAPGTGTTTKTLQLGDFSLVTYFPAIYYNAYFDGTNVRYVRSGEPAWLLQGNYTDNALVAFAAVSGTAGDVIAAFSRGWVVDSAGNVGFGIAAPLAATHALQPTLGSAVQRLQTTATNDDPSEIVYQNRVATTDATVTTLHTFTVPASTTYTIEAHVEARRTGGSAGTAEDGAGYGIVATFKNVAGTATQIGATTALYTHEDQAAWDCVFDVTGATARVRVTGATNNNVAWHLSASRVWQVGT